MSPAKRLHFKGNAAKSRVIGLILDHLEQGRELLIFDYGCGKAAYWPKILDTYPELRLVFFDPNPASMSRATQDLAGKPARALDDPYAEPPLSADFVVSFSVFEHVRDRQAYLAQAFRHLKPGGLLFLNYDDGHFRNTLSLNRPWKSKAQVKELLFNLTARPLALLGKLSHFQRRVNRSDADQMVKEAGFKIAEVFYSNLPSLKGLYGEMENYGWPEDIREEYARKWQEMEEFLNTRILRDEADLRLGDKANLWSHTLSRTMVLRKPNK